MGAFRMSNWSESKCFSRSSVVRYARRAFSESSITFFRLCVIQCCCLKCLRVNFRNVFWMKWMLAHFSNLCSCSSKNASWFFKEFSLFPDAAPSPGASAPLFWKNVFFNKVDIEIFILYLKTHFHWILFLVRFSMSPMPSRTFVISYILLFCLTANMSAAYENKCINFDCNMDNNAFLGKIYTIFIRYWHFPQYFLYKICKHINFSNDTIVCVTNFFISRIQCKI